LKFVFWQKKNEPGKNCLTLVCGSALMICKKITPAFKKQGFEIYKNEFFLN